MADLSEHQRSRHPWEMLPDAGERVFATLNALPQMVWSTDADGNPDFFSERWYEFTGVAQGATDGAAWSKVLHPEDQERAAQIWQDCVASETPYEVEYRLLHHGDGYRWTLARALPVRDAGGDITRWLGTCTDIQDLKATEEQRNLVANELTHRIKNIFAVVASLIRLSARTDPSAQEFADKVGERIAALARAHDYVRPETPSMRAHDPYAAPRADPAQGGPQQTIFGLAASLLAPYQEMGSDSVVLTGFDWPIGPIAATSLALVLHELATNAVKYGALSRPGGRITVECHDSGAEIALVWTETGGPPLDGPPVQSGFGTTMAQRAARVQLDATIANDWRRTGLVTTIALSRQRLAK